MSGTYLAAGLPAPEPMADGLDLPYWQGLRERKLLMQQCASCQTWQWGPEWICHACHSFDMRFEPVVPRGRIYSWQRVWHPVHPALTHQGPYLVILVELPDAGNIRLVGNLLGDPMQAVEIGAMVEGVFEDHDNGDAPYTLLQWTISSGNEPWNR